jgi:hypothetical protein
LAPARRYSSSPSRSIAGPIGSGKLNYIPLMIICLAARLVLGRHLLTSIRPV